eukprot:jgi/Undpi1/9383/HiC_scaffold_27.g11841.m1
MGSSTPKHPSGAQYGLWQERETRTRGKDSATLRTLRGGREGHLAHQSCACSWSGAQSRDGRHRRKTMHSIPGESDARLRRRVSVGAPGKIKPGAEDLGRLDPAFDFISSRMSAGTLSSSLSPP